MTWVLGYPLQPKFATKYAIKHGGRCAPDHPNPDYHYLSYTANHIQRRSGLVDCDSPLLGCWVNFEPQLVITLYVDRQSKTKREADERIDPRKLPPTEYVEKLFHLLRAKGSPGWYRYLDDDWSPKEVERYKRRLAATAAREAKTIVDASGDQHTAKGEKEPTDQRDGEETLESDCEQSGSVASQEDTPNTHSAEPQQLSVEMEMENCCLE